MISYYTLGAGKRLNEIVMAGSHDAGITTGGGNAMTQKYDIGRQAAEGVRVFDLRVAGSATAVVGGQVELKTYHGSLTKWNVSKPVVGLGGGKKDVVQSRMKVGVWGDSLSHILNDAKGFVKANNTEFLILKFDKCKNYPQIAQLCIQELGKRLYKDSGNLNKKTLFDLKGKVIVVFMQAGLDAIDPALHGAGGILGIKNLYEGGAYHKIYNGIQYYGKGGTDLTTRKGKAVDENVAKQLERMRGGAAAGNHNILGMMYWTTTGIVGSIRKRNKMMWEPGNVTEMQKLWNGGLGDAVKQRIPDNVDPGSFAGGPVLKMFLPNIVMIDFASERKCQLIFNLNHSIPTQLTKMVHWADGLDE